MFISLASFDFLNCLKTMSQINNVIMHEVIKVLVCIFFFCRCISFYITFFLMTVQTLKLVVL